MTPSPTSSVLHGLRVLDFGQYIAGPMAAMLLADQGADVIRIDPPGGPRFNSPGNAMWQRGKRSIVLDLRQPSDLAVARELALRADVLIENFRPGVMDRLSLGAEALTAANPQLVYCSLPGFASDDPRSTMPAWEGAIAAAAGAYRIKTQAIKTDAARRRMAPDDGVPNVTILPVPSVYAACMAATSIAMALIARERDGRGQRIEVPLYDAMFYAIGSPIWAGMPGAPLVRQYECADGRWICLTGYSRRFNLAFLNEAGVPKWADESWIGDLQHPYRTTPEKATIAVERLEALFRTRTAQEWEDALAVAGVPAAVCRTGSDWIRLPAAEESGAVVRLDDPVLGPTRQPGVQVHLSDTPGAIRAPAPLLDADRASVLAELRKVPPKTVPSRDAPADPRPPLAGLRVVDLGSVLVGPTCGRTLAEFGADVVKVDDPQGKPPGTDVSRGKRSIYLDLRQPQGQAVLDRLAARADVFLQNFRFGVAERLGYGYEQLHARHPGLVCISFTLYGRQGPWADRPGYEYQAQAATGMQERLGGGPPAIESFTLADYGTALLGTFGVALALLHRARSADPATSGQHVDTALAYTTSLLQSALILDHPAKVIDEPRGPHVLGSGPLQRCYQAADGWLFVGAREADLPALDRATGLQGLAGLRPALRTLFLEQRLRAAPVQAWVERLRAAGACAHAVRTIPEVMAEPWAIAHGLVLDRDDPDGGRAATIGPIPRLSRTPLVPGPVLRPSMEGPDIVAEAGLADQLPDLLASGAVVVRPPKKKAAPAEA